MGLPPVSTALRSPSSSASSYEEVHLHAYDSVSAARDGIGRYLNLYNRRRPHSSLDDQTPDQAYLGHNSHATDPLGGLTPTDDPLIHAESLSEQVRPPQNPVGSLVIVAAPNVA